MLLPTQVVPTQRSATVHAMPSVQVRVSQSESAQSRWPSQSSSSPLAQLDSDAVQPASTAPPPAPPATAPPAAPPPAPPAIAPPPDPPASEPPPASPPATLPPASPPAALPPASPPAALPPALEVPPPAPPDVEPPAKPPPVARPPPRPPALPPSGTGQRPRHVPSRQHTRPPEQTPPSLHGENTGAGGVHRDIAPSTSVTAKVRSNARIKAHRHSRRALSEARRPGTDSRREFQSSATKVGPAEHL